MSLDAGTHTLTASLASNESFAGSTSAAVSLTVNPAATTINLVASANPAVVGQAVTFTATVRGPAGTATPPGIVTFFVGNKRVARGMLDANGQVTFTFVFSHKGQFTLRAVYSGDANFAGSSQSLTEQVNR